MKRSISFVISMILLIGLVWVVVAERETAVAHNASSTKTTTTASGSISGTVTDGTNPLSNILIDLYILDPEYHVSPIIIDSTHTNGSGYYEFTGLEDNSYAIGFADESGNYASEYYDDIRHPPFNLNLPISGGNALPNIDAVLTMSSHISGQVTDAANGNPLAGVSVSASDHSINEWNHTLTDSNGYYTISNILSGNYTVRFFSGIYIGQYYDFASDPENATSVVVGTGATVVNIDASLAEGGHITGRITAEDGITPLENITVRFSENNGPYWELGHIVTTDANGDYHFDGLLADNYHLTFLHMDGLYVQEHYDNVIGSDITTATDISVTLGQTTANINASLAAVQFPPVAVPDVVTTTLNATQMTIDVLANDTDPNGDSLTITSVSSAANGFVMIDGTNILYAPIISFVGIDSFTYDISDGLGGSASALVTVTVENEQQIDVDPAVEETAVIDTSGYDLTINIPANSLPSQSRKLVYHGLDAPTSTLPTSPANIHFTLTLQDENGQEIPNPTFTTPLSVTIQYNPALLPTDMNEADIQVYFFNTSMQSWESIPVVSRNPDTNSLVIELTHFTEFALADSMRVYLPMTIK